MQYITSVYDFFFNIISLKQTNKKIKKELRWYANI